MRIHLLYFYVKQFYTKVDDRLSGHGFLTCYNGTNTHYLSTDLRRNTAYRFVSTRA